MKKIRKKIRKFSLKTAEIKKKNKKKIGSNVENLRKLEPQPEQTFLIKKISVVGKGGGMVGWKIFSENHLTLTIC